MQAEQLFETALGVSAPWFVAETKFDGGDRALTIKVDFHRGSRFAPAGGEGEHPVHDTQVKRYRHLNFFQHECFLEVRLTGESWHRVATIAEHYVDLALKAADFSEIEELAIDETSKARGHDYVTIAADSAQRTVIFVTETREAEAVARLAQDLRGHGADPQSIRAVSIDMSPAYIKGVGEHLPAAEITFDKFHVIAHASHALDLTRRAEQKREPALKGLRWALLKDRNLLSESKRDELDDLLAHLTTKRTARAWQYREDLREILNRKQINVMRTMLWQWCTNVMRSKVEPMKDVAKMIRNHLEGIVA